jgi:hypothetical protein
LATTVVTPAKWPGRWAPQSGPGLEARRVDLFCRGQKQRGDTLAREKLRVPHVVAGVAFEVASRVELDRIHEDRGDDRSGAPAGLAYERQVAGVESPHRRNEADRAAGATLAVGEALHRAHRGDRLHQPLPVGRSTIFGE